MIGQMKNRSIIGERDKWQDLAYALLGHDHT